MADQPTTEIEATNASNNDNGFLGDSYLQKYKLDDRFSSRFIRWIEIPKGYQAVKFRFGTWPTLKNPGIRFVAGLNRFYVTMAVVDMRLRTEEIQTLNATTRDLVDLPSVESILNYQVTYADDAIINAVDYHETTLQTAEARVRGVVGGLHLDQLVSIGAKDPLNNIAEDIKKRNSALDNNGNRYKFEELENAGVKMVGLYMQKINIPEELEALLARGAVAKASAKEIETIAEAQLEAARKRAEAAKLYTENPDGMKLEALRALERISQNQGNNFIVDAGGTLSTILSQIAGMVPTKK